MKKLLMAIIIRPDFIFSYWIFAWFVLHVLHVIKASPKMWLILALIENIISVFLILKAEFYFVFRFIFINFFLKVLPLMYLHGEKITKPDIKFSGWILVVYIVYLLFNKESIMGIYQNIFDAQFDFKKTQGPLSHYYDKAYNALFNIKR
jgi:hypothetical protein